MNKYAQDWRVLYRLVKKKNNLYSRIIREMFTANNENGIVNELKNVTSLALKSENHEYQTGVLNQKSLLRLFFVSIEIEEIH